MKLEEFEMKFNEKSFRVDKSTCPSCGLKMHKIIENKSLFEGSLTFHIIKFHCEKCGREYLDLEQAQVYDMYLILSKRFAGRPLEAVAERFSKIVR